MEGSMVLKMNRRLLLYATLLTPLMLGSLSARAADTIKVAASFSVLGDMVKQIGGDRVEVKTFVGPNGDAHVYEPTPGDAKALVDAKILVVNGLGLEGWMSRLQKSSGFKGKVITATTGIKSRQMEEEEHGKTKKITDPHAWQSLANGRIYVANIRDGLIAADPDGKSTYEANATKFLADIDTVEKDVTEKIAALPATRRKIITTHDAFGYFGATYGMDFIAPEGVSTESEASAKDVAKIIRQIKAEKIPAVFLENVTDHRLLDQIAKETGAKIGGTLFSDALSDERGPAATYLDMFRHNAATLSEALSS
jgi:zinc/manganese transport system substrate-binding protein